MAVEVMPGGMHGGLVQRRGDDHGNPAVECELDGFLDIAISRFAAGGGNLAIDNLVLVLAGDVGNRYFTVLRVEPVQEPEARAQQLVGSPERREIADHRGNRARCRAHLRERLDNDFRPYARRIAHGDANSCGHAILVIPGKYEEGEIIAERGAAIRLRRALRAPVPSGLAQLSQVRNRHRGFSARPARPVAGWTARSRTTRPPARHARGRPRRRCGESSTVSRPAGPPHSIELRVRPGWWRACRSMSCR